jgi:LmbE family N-acetylglucosaminyl deacetylase
MAGDELTLSMLQDRSRTVLFLLAHQDDEIVVAPVITWLLTHGRPVRVVYLTNGGSNRSTQAARNSESTRALASLGLAECDVSFLGSALAIPDGELFRHFTRTYSALEEACDRAGELGDVFTLAWEGGHPDHDAAHVLAMRLGRERGDDQHVWQAPFYRAAGWGPPWFSMFAPLSRNGPVWQLPASRECALLRLQMIRFYPSQWRSFAGLGPVMAGHAIMATPVRLQRVAVRRALERPTAEPLLYEHRNGVSFAEFVECAEPFLREGRSDVATQPPDRTGRTGAPEPEVRRR